MLLICQHCKRPTAAEARFCSDCGTELFRQECSACHATNELGAQHCRVCGVALRAAAALAAAAGTPGRTGFAPPPEFTPSSTANGLVPVITPEHPLATSLVAQAPVQWQDPAPTGGPRRHPALAPFLVGLGTVGTLAMVSIAFVNWSTSSTDLRPIQPLDRPVAAGLAPERGPVADKSVDAAADAATAAAAKLLDPPAGAERRAGPDAPGPAAAPTGVAPTAAAPVRPAGERDVPPAQVPAQAQLPAQTQLPAQAQAPAMSQAGFAAAADAAVATRAEARVPRKPATQPARADLPAPPTARAPEAPPPVRALPAQPTLEPRLAAREPRPKPQPSVLPRECTAAMQALAICATSSKPPGS